jgi:hypothetical protein
VPGDGAYTVPMRVEPVEFHRHDKTNGMRSAESVEVAFFGVTIETSQKISEAVWERSDQCAITACDHEHSTSIVNAA